MMTSYDKYPYFLVLVAKLGGCTNSTNFTAALLPAMYVSTGEVK